MASAAAKLRELETGSRPQEIARARARVRAAAEELEQARRELRRTRTLYEGGAVSRSAYDRARTQAEVAASRLEEAEEHLQLVVEGPKAETVEAQRGVLEEARSALTEVEARLDKATLAAPFAGRVAERHKEPGELAAPGAPVVTLRNLDDRWVRVYVPEDRLGAVHLGDPATILSDTYPDARYDGRIFYIADQAEFTPKTVQTKEERVRLVYAAKVRVTGDPDHELKPGMPVDVEIDVGTGRRAGGG